MEKEIIKVRNDLEDSEIKQQMINIGFSLASKGSDSAKVSFEEKGIKATILIRIKV